MVLHALDGRMRVKLADVKGRAERAREIEARTIGIAGVQYVRASALTGNALIVYDRDVIDHAAILEVLRSWEYLWSGPPPPPGPIAGLGDKILRAVAETLLQRLLTVLLVV